jgi:hypothetical protein
LISVTPAGLLLAGTLFFPLPFFCFKKYMLPRPLNGLDYWNDFVSNGVPDFAGERYFVADSAALFLFGDLGVGRD